MNYDGFFPRCSQSPMGRVSSQGTEQNDPKSSEGAKGTQRKPGSEEGLVRETSQRKGKRNTGVPPASVHMLRSQPPK